MYYSKFISFFSYCIVCFEVYRSALCKFAYFFCSIFLCITTVISFCKVITFADCFVVIFEYTLFTCSGIYLKFSILNICMEITHRYKLSVCIPDSSVFKYSFYCTYCKWFFIFCILMIYIYFSGVICKFVFKIVYSDDITIHIRPLVVIVIVCCAVIIYRCIVYNKLLSFINKATFFAIACIVYCNFRNYRICIVFASYYFRSNNRLRASYLGIYIRILIAYFKLR